MYGWHLRRLSAELGQVAKSVGNYEPIGRLVLLLTCHENQLLYIYPKCLPAISEAILVRPSNQLYYSPTPDAYRLRLR
jgi:hypothetical protein